MIFESRELPDFVEHVPVATLRQGETYFTVSFVDDRMVVPELRAVVFVGRDLESGDDGLLYFQDYESYQDGARYDKMIDGIEAEFESFEVSQSSGVLDYERALDVLLRCSLRRR